MPEGPEIWILQKAINNIYNDVKTLSYGKHLFILDKNENWSFGLTGRVKINDTNKLIKSNVGWVYGNETKYENISNEINKLGVDYMTATRDEFATEISRWTQSKNKLSKLMLDQSKISGIGVAWGSEILHKAGLRPDVRACDQDLHKLVDVMLETRQNIKITYNEKIENIERTQNKDELTNFVNNWFENLYEIREMSVYKKGLKLKVLGRTWWVMNY